MPSEKERERESPLEGQVDGLKFTYRLEKFVTRRNLCIMVAGLVAPRSSEQVPERSDELSYTKV